MTRKFRAVCISLLLSAGLYAQSIENLNPKVRIIGGEAYYLHHVLEDQSLKAIADAYKCDEAAIKKANPEKTDPIEVGTTLRIPYTDQSAVVMSKYDLKLNSLSSSSIYDEEIPAEVLVEEQVAIDEIIEIEEAKPTSDDVIEEEVIEEDEVEEVTPEEEILLEVEVLEQAVMEEEVQVSSNAIKVEDPVDTEVEETIPDKEPEKEVSEADQEALAALSATLKESMNSLDDAQKKVEEKPVLDDDGLPKKEKAKIPAPDEVVFRNKNQNLSEFLELSVQPMIQDQNDFTDEFQLKEFFLVRVNKDGVITNVRDERTETNNNTRILEPDSLKGYRLTEDLELLDNQFQSIGLVSQIKRDTYLVKGKISGVKYLGDLPTSREQALIENYMDRKSLFGKYNLVIVDADYYLATYEPFEYNPFGELRQKLYFNSEKRVESARLK